MTQRPRCSPACGHRRPGPTAGTGRVAAAGLQQLTSQLAPELNTQSPARARPQSPATAAGDGRRSGARSPSGRAAPSPGRDGTGRATLSLALSALSGFPPPPPRFLSSVMFGSFRRRTRRCHISRLRSAEGGRRGGKTPVGPFRSGETAGLSLKVGGRAAEVRLPLVGRRYQCRNRTGLRVCVSLRCGFVTVRKITTHHFRRAFNIKARVPLVCQHSTFYPTGVIQQFYPRRSARGKDTVLRNRLVLLTMWVILFGAFPVSVRRKSRFLPEYWVDQSFTLFRFYSRGMRFWLVF